jgi:hypothetical protein
MAGTFYWGWVGDHHGITKTMLLISVTDAIAKLLLFAVSGKIGFAFYFLLIGLFDKGMITVVGPGLVELFGIQGGTELLPFKASSVLITFAIIPIMQIATRDTWTPFEFLRILAVFNIITIVPCTILWKINPKH